MLNVFHNSNDNFISNMGATSQAGFQSIDRVCNNLIVFDFD